jgi:glycosyltransferase involved in cell wall biosynthesis
MKKKILIVEPFFSGSHASWLKQYVERSAHDIELLTMDGRFWKWRMYGGAYTMADAYMALDYVPDVILTTDMMDLSTFLALIRKKLQPTTQIKVYFHENQFAYPWKESAEDVKLKRDVHYGFTNYSTAAVADQVLFNSAYNMNSFFAGLQDNLRRMPDYRHDHAVEDLRKKSKILPIGIPLKKIHASSQVPYAGEDPLILWNHRWEHDKNPKDFFDALRAIKAEGYPFKLALLGDRYHRCPKEFEAGLRDFENEIIKTGLLKGDEYASWLRASDIIPITSNHDFFGISVMEAVYAGSYPILPNRLTYPDLYKINDHPDLFYETQQELVDKLKYAIKHIHTIRKVTYSHLAQPYDWENLIQIYDDTIGN